MLERNVLHRTLTPPDGYQGKLYGNAAMSNFIWLLKVLPKR